MSTASSEFGSIAEAEAVDKEWEAFDQHQASAPRLGFAEEARTILDVARSVLANELVERHACWFSVYSACASAIIFA